MADDWYLDAHSDIPSSVIEERLQGREQVISRDFLPGMVEGRIGLRVAATIVDDAYLPELGLRRALKSVSHMRREIDETPELELVIDAADVRQAAGTDVHSLLLSLEGAEPLMGDLDMVDTFYTMGVRLLTLTHSRRNAVGDGAPYTPRTSGTPGGISQFGEDLIDRLDDLGIILDVSHLNEPGFWDALRVAEGPVIASHSNSRELCSHERNLSDDAVAAIADTGGVIGIMAVSDFVTPSGEPATVKELLDHVEHAVAVAGPEHVGFGFDFYEYLASYHDDWGNEIPFGGHVNGLDGDAEVASLVSSLRERGFDDDVIRGLMHGNFLRVFEDILP